MKTKNQKSTTKTPTLMDGYVERRSVRCGKQNCRCAGGQRHVAHYLIQSLDGRRHRRYIRRADLADVQAATGEYRKLQAELREGRAQYRALIAQGRELLSFLSKAEKAGWRV